MILSLVDELKSCLIIFCDVKSFLSLLCKINLIGMVSTKNKDLDNNKEISAEETT
jgi:hypothetical protein